jgi:hypothetical protein
MVSGFALYVANYFPSHDEVSSSVAVATLHASTVRGLCCSFRRVILVPRGMRPYTWHKRVLDMVLSGVWFVCSTPLWLLIAVAVKL